MTENEKKGDLPDKSPKTCCCCQVGPKMFLGKKED